MGVRGQAERGGEVALRRRMVCEEAETPDAYKEDSWKVLERKKNINQGNIQASSWQPRARC